MGKKEAKTNAIRILETMKIPYEAAHTSAMTLWMQLR